MGKKIKSAYESALERLGGSDTAEEGDVLTEKQKEALAEIDRVYEAKVAERKILAESEVARLVSRGKFEEVAKVKQKLVATLGKLEEEKKREKQKVRSQDD
jgi:hypothetical protein